jgi:hypothetical protein
MIFVKDIKSKKMELTVKLSFLILSIKLLLENMKKMSQNYA